MPRVPSRGALPTIASVGDADEEEREHATQLFMQSLKAGSNGPDDYLRSTWSFGQARPRRRGSLEPPVPVRFTSFEITEANAPAAPAGEIVAQARLAFEEKRAFGSDMVTSLCLVGMGMSAFPITETLLLQTAMFTSCWGWGGYYGLATVTLFLPGLFIQLAQNRWDQGFDRDYGTRKMGCFRLGIGHGLQIAALGVFLGSLHDMEVGHTSTAHTMLLVLTFVVIGLGCSIVYGACAQIISIFPCRYHPYFFVGTYSVSVIIAPFNVAIGALYNHADLAPAALRNLTSGQLKEYQCEGGHGLMWDKIALYYTVGVVFEVVGVVAFVVLCFFTAEGEATLAAKDDSLRSSVRRGSGSNGSPAVLELQSVSSRSDHDGASGGGGDGGQPLEVGVEAAVRAEDGLSKIGNVQHISPAAAGAAQSRMAKLRSSSRSSSREKRTGNGKDNSLYEGLISRSSNSALGGTGGLTAGTERGVSAGDGGSGAVAAAPVGGSVVGSSLLDIWWQCLPVGVTMMLALAENLLICGEYDSLPLHLEEGTNECREGCIESLHTVMMYAYYAMQCLGAVTVMVPVVSRTLTPRLLFALALLRLPFVPLIFDYNRESELAKQGSGTIEDAGGMNTGGTVGGGGAPGSSRLHDADDSHDWFGSDPNVVAVYCVVQWLGGVVFARCFSVATELFEDTASRSVAATVMNVLYFAGMCGVSFPIYAMH